MIKQTFVTGKTIVPIVRHITESTIHHLTQQKASETSRLSYRVAYQL